MGDCRVSEPWESSLRRLHESGAIFEDSGGRVLVWPDEVVEQFARAGSVWYRATPQRTVQSGVTFAPPVFMGVVRGGG